MFTLAAIVCYLILVPFVLLQDPLFVGRVFFDLLYFFFIIIIVLNLILGVIIDTFAALRSEKQEKEDILNNSCFICGKVLKSYTQLVGQACWNIVQGLTNHHSLATSDAVGGYIILFPTESFQIYGNYLFTLWPH